MKRILFDLRAIQPFAGLFNFHGGAEYGLAVLSYLKEQIKDSESELLGVAFEGLELDERIFQYLGREQIGYVRGWSDVPEYAREIRADLFYSALPYEYDSCSFDGIDVVFTIHGLRQLEMPSDVHEWRYASGLKETIKAGLRFSFLRRVYIRKKYAEMGRLLNVTARSLEICVPSLHTKFSLLSHYPRLRSEEVFTCPSPLRDCDPLNAGATREFLESLAVKKDAYILLVSANRWLKNAYRAIQALDQLYEEGRLERVTILAGMEPNHPFLKKVKNPSRFHAVGYVPPAHLESLYQNAFCLLYPTLNEGFGYPPVEAMKYGTPVIASALSAVSEVCGDAVSYTNPYSVCEMKIRLLQLMHDSELRQRLSQRGKERYAWLLDREKRMMTIFCKQLLT